MKVTNEKRREVAAKVRETMGALGQVELDGIPLADLIEPEECDGCEPGAWEVVAMEVAERLGVAVGGCLPSDYADAINEALDRSLMPEGCEWPRYEDGEPVRFGDRFIDHQGNERSVLNVKMWQEGGFEIGTGQGTYDWHEAGERVKRPVPKVLDADGVEIRVGDKPYRVDNGKQVEVRRIDPDYGEECVFVGIDGTALGYWLRPDQLTHRAPVLAADGRPLREGETVYDVKDKHAYPHTVVSTELDGLEHVKTTCEEPNPARVSIHPSRLTHERPDSWERLEEDAKKGACDYFGHADVHELCKTCPAYEHSATQGGPGCREAQMVDIVRRARALAGDA